MVLDRERRGHRHQASAALPRETRRVDGRLGVARLRCQIDVGFGDAIVGAAPTIVYPTLLDQAAPRLRAYPAVAVIAEKLHAVVEFGMDNSEMKDFYDLRVLPQQLAFAGDELAAAIAATLARRGITLGAELPSVSLASSLRTQPRARGGERS